MEKELGEVLVKAVKGLCKGKLPDEELEKCVDRQVLGFCSLYSGLKMSEHETPAEYNARRGHEDLFKEGVEDAFRGREAQKLNMDYLQGYSLAAEEVNKRKKEKDI